MNIHDRMDEKTERRYRTVSTLILGAMVPFALILASDLYIQLMDPTGLWGTQDHVIQGVSVFGAVVFAVAGYHGMRTGKHPPMALLILMGAVFVFTLFV